MCRAMTDPRGGFRCPLGGRRYRHLTSQPSLTPAELEELRGIRKAAIAGHPEVRAEKLHEGYEKAAFENTTAWTARLDRLGSKLPRDISDEDAEQHKAEQRAKLAEAKSSKFRATTTQRERDEFVEDARRQGITPGELFSQRLREPMPFLPVAAGQLPQKQHTSSNGGRPPSQSGMKRNAPLDFRLSKAELAALTDTAAHYRLSEADLSRSIITGTDPRISWGHIGSGGLDGGRAAQRLAHFENKEAGYDNPVDAYQGLSTSEWLARFEEQHRPVAEANLNAWLDGEDKKVEEAEAEEPQVAERLAA